jgi:hypothetical protein
VSAAVLRALAVSIVADARAELARAEAHAAQLNALAKDMGRAVEGDPVQLVNATVAGVGRAVWNRAARSGALRAKKLGREYVARRADVAAWLASIASPPPPASNVKNETEEPADTFERARARARDRQAA